MPAKEWRYVPGDFWRICDRTGKKVRASQTRKEWNGLIVRERSWEPRNQQDLVRGRIDPQAVPEPRPRQPNVFISTAQMLPNLLHSSDQQAANWPGMVQGGAFIVGPSGSMVVTQIGGTTDASNYYPPQLSIPSNANYDLGSVRRFQLSVVLSFIGWPNNQAFTTTGVTPVDLFRQRDLFSMPDLFGTIIVGSTDFNISQLPLVWNAYVDARVEISLSNDNVTWTDWAKAANTIYTARYVGLRVWLATYDENTSIIVTGFSYQIAGA